jgi:trans-aconitate 2-methyltransferase
MDARAELASLTGACYREGMSQDAWSPSQYDKFKSERSQPFFDLMALLDRGGGAGRGVGADPGTGLRVVDLGCGTGELTAQLHRSLGATSTEGIDSSEAMLQTALSLQVPGLHFVKGDIGTWEEPAKYDVVFSNAALQWCDHHAEIFARLKNSLRPGGQLAVQMPMNHDYATHVIARKLGMEPPWAGLLGETSYDKNQAMLTVEQYAELLFRLGFREQKVFVRVYGHVLPSRDAVIEWVRGTLLTYFKARLSVADYARFEDEFRTRLFATIADERPFFYPFKRLLLWARL